MKSIFNESDFSHLMERIEKLSEHSKPEWGKMNVSQMLHHLNCSTAAPLGRYQTKGKPNFLLKLFKSVSYNDRPFGKGVPTPSDFKVTGAYDFHEEKESFLNHIKELTDLGHNGKFLPHVAFGELTGEQWGKHTFKHIDHHLKQFGI
jgi:hypothetical protein